MEQFLIQLKGFKWRIAGNTVLKHNRTVLISLMGDSGFDIGGLVFTNILTSVTLFQPVISFFGFGEGIVDAFVIGDIQLMIYYL